MDPRAILSKKRHGRELSEEEIERFLRGYVAGEIPDYQASALLMAIFVHGMREEELEHWTRAMLHSGTVLDFAHVAAPKVDKHSTGGIGDKASIPLAPAAAACGLAVPMISGRGLGHTGGTLDKLESIPGFRTDLDEREIERGLVEVGLAFGAQTEDLVPADRKLYALRDATGLVESIPLIASSILSKKLAEGLDGLVLDVKFGSGAFLPEVERGAELARCMVSLAARFGLRASAFQTAMDRPLGAAAGNALEIAESLDCLRGGGPEDLARLVHVLGGEMLRLGGLVETNEEGEARIARALADGSALERFVRAIELQGGDPRCVERPDSLPHAPDRERITSDRAGTLRFTDLRAIGLAVVELGGGRRLVGDAIDPAVGLVFHARHGERVERGAPIAELHHRAGRGLERARALVASSYSIGEAFEPTPLVLARLGEV